MVTLSRLDEDERLRIERFEAAYNSIDRFLRQQRGRECGVPFSLLIREFLDANRWWVDYALLRSAGELRNVVVHNKTVPGQPIAVPTQSMVEQLEAAQDRLVRPQRAIPTFRKLVETVGADDSIAGVLVRIAKQNLSQFPVYQQKSFQGLLTENGLTRWIARHVATAGSLVEFADHTVAQVLRQEESKRTWEFAARDESAAAVRNRFALNPLLEAVIITDQGKPAESPLGIATRWDVVRFPS